MYVMFILDGTSSPSERRGRSRSVYYGYKETLLSLSPSFTLREVVLLVLKCVPGGLRVDRVTDSTGD